MKMLDRSKVDSNWIRFGRVDWSRKPYRCHGKSRRFEACTSWPQVFWHWNTEFNIL